jgi:uncharacterized protein (TIGR02001 family)
MIRSLSLALAVSLTAVPALAQSGGDWSFGLGAATDNRSKNASKSDGDPYVWGLAEWESADGLFYAGPGFETIKSSGSDLELELGGGIRPQIAGFDVDLNAAHKWRVDADPGSDDDAWEFTANVSRSIGPAKARLQLQHSPDGTGSTRAWTWVEGQIGWDFTDKLSGSAAVGRREQDGAPDYTGWNIGATYALTRTLELEVRYHDTDADAPGEQYASALVAGISVYF